MSKSFSSNDQTQKEESSIGFSSRNSSLAKPEQILFKIGSSFIQQDSLSTQNQSKNSELSLKNKSFKNSHPNKNPIKNPSNQYSNQMLIKINKLNDNIKALVVFQRQFKEKNKLQLKKFAQTKEVSKNLRRNFLQIAKKKLKRAEQIFSESKMQPIKRNRIAKLPSELQKCFMNNNDKREFKKKKFISVLITQKDKQMCLKNGLVSSDENERDLNEMIKNYQQHIKDYNRLIDSQHLRKSIQDMLLQNNNQVGQQLKKSWAFYTKMLNEFDEKIAAFVQNQAQALSCIQKQYLINQMEFEKGLIEKSEDLLQIVPTHTLITLSKNLNNQYSFEVSDL